jgi:hypothetical protein
MNDNIHTTSYTVIDKILIEGQDTSIIKNKMMEIEMNNSLKKEPINPFINDNSEVSKEDFIFSYYINFYILILSIIIIIKSLLFILVRIIR